MSWYGRTAIALVATQALLLPMLGTSQSSILARGLSPGLSACDSDAFFVSSLEGSDDADGSRSAPWKTLNHGLSMIKKGGVLCLLGGNYGDLIETQPGLSVGHRTIRSEAGHHSVLRSVQILYPTAGSAGLSLVGLIVDSTGVKTPVQITNAEYVNLLALEISSERWVLRKQGSIGIAIRGAREVSVQSSKIHGVHRGLQVSDSSRIRISQNLIQTKFGTGIQYLGNNTQGLIENNHIEGHGDPGELQDFPDYHSSIISVRSSDLIVRNNNLHGMGNSSGLMLYQQDAAGGAPSYSDIKILSNAIYNTESIYALRIYNLGDRVEIRDNFLHSRERPGSCQDGSTKDARYRLETALAIHSISEAAMNPTLTLTGNLFAGAVTTPDGLRLREHSNIVWSWQHAGEWLQTSPQKNSQILNTQYSGCGQHSRKLTRILEPEITALQKRNPYSIQFRRIDGSLVNPGGKIGPDRHIVLSR